ncbi:MAG: hypothetical protein WCJ01_06475 [Ignavibacteria bacterium]
MDVTKTGTTNFGFLNGMNLSNTSLINNKNISAINGISDISRGLYQSDIDLSNSTFTFKADSTNFNLQFLHQTEQKITLNGYLSKEQTSGSFSFAYNYSQTEVKDGKPVDKQYEVNFSFSFNSSKSVSIEKKEKKEDILDFLRRITREIFTKLNDKKANISAIVLDQEDLKDLSQLTDKKAVQLIYQLIDMINFAIEAKKMANKNKDAQDSIYHPKRIKETVNETVASNETNFNYSFSIKEVGNSSSAE